MRRGSRAWFGALLLAPFALGGCFVMSWGRDAIPPVSGPAPYVEGCQACHGKTVGAHYAESLHTAKGIRCGQCHVAGGHPNFTAPVRDAKCGGCHLPQYEQTLASTHFATRDQRALDNDRAARVALRRERFSVPAATGRRFVGDSSSGELGGRLCVACHYDEHRLGLRVVRRADFCGSCHGGVTSNHFPIPTPGLENRCILCHVRAGVTESGQIVNTHRFAKPGAAP